MTLKPADPPLQPTSDADGEAQIQAVLGYLKAHSRVPEPENTSFERHRWEPPNKPLRRFLLRIVLPSLLVIGVINIAVEAPDFPDPLQEIESKWGGWGQLSDKHADRGRTVSAR